MGSLKYLTIATAALLASTVIANAADIIEPPVVEIVPEYTPVSSGGWYLRGDIGYAHMSVSHVDYIIADDISNPQFYDFVLADMDETWSYGAGIGYQINGMLRVDATLRHYGDSNFTGDSTSVAGAPYACSALAADNGSIDQCNASDTATFAATALLANAYADLGTFGGFTPYLGAGIGGAYTHWSALNNDITCDTAIGDCLDGTGQAYNLEFDGVHGAKNGWRFAYGLHAGASYDVSQNVKFDAGYTFTHIDGGDMFGFDGGGGGVMGHHGDIKIHEVRAGLRYSFN